MPSGKEKTRNAGMSALLEGLMEAGIEFILVGGLAAVVQGAPITTMDVDIVHRQTADNISKLLAFLKTIDAYHRRLDDKVIKPTGRHLSVKGHALFTTLLGPLDVLAFIEQGLSYEELVEHTIKIEFRGYSLRVLDLEMIVELKRSSKHPVDKQRLPVLEETLRQLKQEGASVQGLKGQRTSESNHKGRQGGDSVD
jgi:hypothetical protein